MGREERIEGERVVRKEGEREHFSRIGGMDLVFSVQKCANTS